MGRLTALVRRHGRIARVASVSIVVVGAFLVGAALAESPPTPLCIPEAFSKPVKTPNSNGGCTNTKTVTYKLVELGKEGKEGPAGPAIVARIRGEVTQTGKQNVSYP